MAVIDTENAMRNSTRAAKRVRFEPGATSGSGAMQSTNVQDAINEVAAAGIARSAPAEAQKPE